MVCNKVCRICKKAIYSQTISIVDDTLVIDIPADNYGNKCEYCLFIIDEIPDEATLNQLVAISIGGDTSTLYPLIRCDGVQVVAREIVERSKLCVKVATNTTTGVFRVLYGLVPCVVDVLESLPVPATTTPAVAELRTTATPSKVTKTTTTTKKEVVSNE